MGLALLGLVFGALVSSLAGLVLLIDAPARRALRARGLRAEVERWAGPSVAAVTVNFRRDGRVVRRVRADMAWARRLRLNGMHESRFAWRRAACGNRIVRIFRNRWRRLFRVYQDTRRNLRTDAAPARGWPVVMRDGRDPPLGLFLFPSFVPGLVPGPPTSGDDLSKAPRLGRGHARPRAAPGRARGRERGCARPGAARSLLASFTRPRAHQARGRTIHKRSYFVLA